eukprot:1295079-Ditylum_brightwellii.AAC.1
MAGGKPKDNDKEDAAENNEGESTVVGPLHKERTIDKKTEKSKNATRNNTSHPIVTTTANEAEPTLHENTDNQKEDTPEGVDPQYSTSVVKSSDITNDERGDNKTTIEVKLNSETKANLENLQGLTRSRNAMLANAKEVLPKKYMDQYDSFSLRGTLYQPEGNLDTLHSRCEAILPLFQQTLTRITKAAGLDPDEVAIWQNKDNAHL